MKLGLTTESFLSAIQGGRMNLIKIIDFAHQHGFEGIQIVNCKDTWRKDISDDIKMNLMRMRERKVRYFSYGVKYDLGHDDSTTRWRAMNKIREAILLAGRAVRIDVVPVVGKDHRISTYTFRMFKQKLSPFPAAGKTWVRPA